jgi:hypothetical protein
MRFRPTTELEEARRERVSARVARVLDAQACIRAGRAAAARTLPEPRSHTFPREMQWP